MTFLIAHENIALKFVQNHKTNKTIITLQTQIVKGHIQQTEQKQEQ